MKNRGLCLFLAFLFSFGCIVFASAAALPEQETPAETAAAAEADAVPEDGAQEETTEPPAVEDTPDPEPTEEEPAGTEEGSDPIATAPPADTTSVSVSVEGSGYLEAYSDGTWSRIEAGTETLELPRGATQLRAVGEMGAELESVTLNDAPLEFWPDEVNSFVWLFQVDSPASGSVLSAVFSTIVPVNVGIEGPGTLYMLDGSEWTELVPGADAFGAAPGAVVTLAAKADQEGNAATSIVINNQDVVPSAYTTQGVVFTLEVEGPECTVAAVFTETDQIKANIAGEGTVYLTVGDRQIEVQNEALVPYSAGPLAFELLPAEGYAMSGAAFNSKALPVDVKENTEDAPVVYTCSVPEPTDGGTLSVTFLAASNSVIQWIRGVDSTSGISWAVPLGTSVYGTSNVTSGSKVLVTRLTQGSVYAQAAAKAAQYGGAFVIWDISLVDAQGAVYEPTVPVLMNMPIPSGYPTTASGLRMLHILDNGTVETNPLTVEINPANGVPYISMQVPSLSTFALVNTTAQAAAGTQNPGTAVTTTGATSPQTGDSANLPLWWILAAGAGALLAGSAFRLRKVSASGK